MIGKKRRPEWDNGPKGYHKKSRASAPKQQGESGPCITWAKTDDICPDCSNSLHRSDANIRCFTCGFGV